MKHPMFDRATPVTFLAAIDRLSSVDVPGSKAIAKRAYYAMAGIQVTCWQGSRRVAVPLAEAR